MRTTLALEDDVYLFARTRAQRENISIGQAVSRLVREGIRAQNTLAPAVAAPKSRYALLPARDEIITTEHVRDLMDQEGI
jgi:hypothetical protein